MKTIIQINKTDALKAGLDNQGDYALDFDPAEVTQEQRDELASSDTTSYNHQHPHTWIANRAINNNIHAGGVAVPDLAALRTLLDARIARRAGLVAEAKAADEKTVTKYMARADEDLIDLNYPLVGAPEINYKYRAREDFLPAAERLQDAAALARIEHLKTEVMPAMLAGAHVEWEAEQKRIAEVRARNKREAAEKKAAEAAKLRRQADQISAWVAARGTNNQLERQAAGLLPADEIVALIRAEAFLALDGWPRYLKLRASDVCEGYEDYDGTSYHDVDFDADDAETLDADQFDALRDLRTLAPNADVTARIHTGECEECSKTVTRIGYMVRITVGDFDLSREYGIFE